MPNIFPDALRAPALNASLVEALDELGLVHDDDAATRADHSRDW